MTGHAGRDVAVLLLLVVVVDAVEGAVAGILLCWVNALRVVEGIYALVFL